ncbi:MAG: methyl-accepting chemotaxis protein [Spirochaetes bacterium]|nr:methyl-accepting chemotaxis protein [Spirochaetota bacterium]
MAEQSFKRRKFIVDKDFQFRFIFSIYVIIFILIVVLGFFLISSSSSEIAGSIYSKITQIKNTKEIFSGMVLKFSIIAVIVAFIVIALRFLFLSHRIVGPLVRFKQCLKKVGQGDLTVKLIFRDKDELKDLAAIFTENIMKLNNKVKDVKASSRTIDTVLKKGKLSDSDINKLRKEHQNLIKNLDSIKL